MTGAPYREMPECDHGISFEKEEYLQRDVPEIARKPISSTEVRRRWPRLDGRCPLGCGYTGIFYASYLHYIAGDW